MLQHPNMITKGMALCTGKAQQNMNTELSPEITRTCSKGHDKIANNNRFTDFVKNWTWQ